VRFRHPDRRALQQARAERAGRREVRPRTATLTCPGQKAKDRDICAALDVVAPKVFEPVPVDEACTAIYGGPRKATITGTFQEEAVSAVFTQENGCEIARWNQIKPVLDALGLPA